MFNNKILNNISWLLIDKLLTLIISLVILVKVANHYGPNIYGLYQYSISITLLLGIIILFIDGRVVKKLYPETDYYHVIFNTTLAKIILSFFSLIIGILLTPFLIMEDNFLTIYFLLLINNIVNNLSFGIQNFFEYNLHSKKIVFATNISNLVSATFQIIAISNDLSIIIIVLIIFFSSILKLLILCYQYYKDYEFKIFSNYDINLIKSIIKESLPLAIAAIAATIYARIDQIMIGNILDMENVGIYSISVQMMSVAAIIIGPIQISIFPNMIKWYNSDINKYYHIYQMLTFIITWISIIIILLSITIVPLLFYVFFDNIYSESIYLFKLHILSILFMYNAILRSSHFTLSKSTNILMITQIVSVFINIIINLILIPKIGLNGAVIATILTQFCSLLLSNIIFKDSRKIFWIQIKAFNPKYFLSIKKYYNEYRLL